MENIILSQKLIEHLNKKKKSSIVIYRGMDIIGCCAGVCFKFIVKAKVQDGKKTNELFKKVTTTNGISVWVESALLERVKKNYVFVDLAGIILKRLKISIQTFEKASKFGVN